jgi:hypothetical protein
VPRYSTVLFLAALAVVPSTRTAGAQDVPLDSAAVTVWRQDLPTGRTGADSGGAAR